MAASKSTLRKIFDSVRGFIGGMFGTREDAERKHEREMANLDAFNRGKITPSFAMRYAGVILFFLVGLFIIVEAAFPDWIPGEPIKAVEHLARLCGDMLKAIFGM